MRSLAPGELPSFPAETAGIRGADWTVAGTLDDASAAALTLRRLDGYLDARQRLQSLQQGTNAPESGGDGLVVVADTLFATLEAEEILHELCAHRVALQADPPGFLFNFIELFGDRPECILPDRDELTETTPCLRAYYQHLSAVGDRRGARLLEGPRATDRQRFDDERPVESADLLQVPRGRITEPGLRRNIRVVLRFLAGAPGADRAEAELARAQLWQWVRLDTGVLDEGRVIDKRYFRDQLQTIARRPETVEDELDPMRIEAATRRLDELTVCHDLTGALGAAD